MKHREQRGKHKGASGGRGRAAGRGGANSRSTAERAARAPFWNSDFARGALLIVATLVAYAPVYGATWIWDDNRYITQNAKLLTWSGLGDIWFHPHANIQYYPIVFSIFWLEYQIWGLAPFGYHLINILLHVANSVLVWRIFTRARVPGAWGLGLLFALHPAHVESVAWATELKDVLSGCFALAALWFWDELPGSAGVPPAWPKRWSSSLFIAASILAIVAKPVVCPFVVVLPLWSWWRRGRVGLREWMLLLPGFVVAVAMGLIHLSVERQNMSNDPASYGADGIARLLVAARASWFYLGKLAWPWPLMTFYPRWEMDAKSPLQWIPVIAAALLLVVLWRARRTLGRGPLSALLGFGLMLAPALGFAKGGFFRYSFVSDHFQYLASIGPLALAAALVARVRQQALGSPPGNARLTQAIRFAPACALAALAGLTIYQGTTYADAEALWRHNSEYNHASAFPHDALGRQLLQKGKYTEAVVAYRDAVALDPQLEAAWWGLGEAERHGKQLDNAVNAYYHALSLRPEDEDAMRGLGVVLGMQGKSDESLAQLRAAVRIKPADAYAHDSIGVALATQAKFPEAETEFKMALALRPSLAEAQQHLKMVRQKLATDSQLKSAGLPGIGPGDTVTIPIAPGAAGSGRGAAPAGRRGAGAGATRGNVPSLR